MTVAAGTAAPTDAFGRSAVLALRIIALFFRKGKANMKEYDSGAYLVSRRYRNRKPEKYKSRRPRKAAGVLIAVLLLLTAGICLLVVFLPSLSTPSGGAPSFKGKTYYMLATAEVTDRAQAVVAAQYAAERGGAGYIYNNGSYHIIAAVYERETDAKTLASVNADSHYFALAVPPSTCGAGDKRALEYLTGEWFNTVTVAATELDRGNITESAAEHALSAALRRLRDHADGAETARLKRALTAVCEYAMPQSVTVLSYLRYVQVYAVIAAQIAFA